MYVNSYIRIVLMNCVGQLIITRASNSTKLIMPLMNVHAAIAYHVKEKKASKKGGRKVFES